MVWRDILHAVCPHARKDILDGVAEAMPAIIDEYQLTTTSRIARFLGQCAEESDGFRTLEEYASGRAYEGRRDLGNVKRGDGVRYKGRSPLQLSGRANYAHAAEKLGVDLINHPELAAELPLAMHVAGLYWTEHKLNELADKGDDRSITKKINGGLNGFETRKIYTNRFLKALGEAVDLNEIFDPNDWPRSKVAALQTQLDELSYHTGGPDGRLGPVTAAAISAFQHDNELPITGFPNADLEEAIWAATETRPVPVDRAGDVPQDSKIVEHAGGAILGTVVAGASASIPDSATVNAGIQQANEVLAQAEQAKDVWMRLVTLVKAFGGGLGGFLEAHPFQIIATAALFYVAWKIWRVREERIADHRSYKTL